MAVSAGRMKQRGLDAERAELRPEVWIRSDDCRSERKHPLQLSLNETNLA